MKVFSNAEEKYLEGAIEPNWTSEYLRTLKYRIREKADKMLYELERVADAGIHRKDHVFRALSLARRMLEREGYGALSELISVTSSIVAKYYSVEGYNEKNLKKIILKTIAEYFERVGDLDLAKTLYELSIKDDAQ